MKEDNGWFTLIQITIGAYICYFEYIMYLLISEHRDPNDVRKERQGVIMKYLNQIKDFIFRIIKHR